MVKALRHAWERRCAAAVSQSPTQAIRPVPLLVLVGLVVCATVGAKPSRAANPSPRSAMSLSAGLIGPARSAVPPYGPAAGTELGQLPVLQPGESAGGASSFDRDTNDARHGNKDWGNFLGTGSAGNVMLDEVGPGC